MRFIRLLSNFIVFTIIICHALESDSIKTSNEVANVRTFGNKKYVTMPSEVFTTTTEVPIKFGNSLETRRAFELHTNQILHSVLETRGSLHISESQSFFITTLTVSMTKSLQQLYKDRSCDAFNPDPNSFIRYLKEVGKETKKKADKQLPNLAADNIREVKFSVVNLNYAEQRLESVNFLRLRTSYGRTLYSSPFQMNENEDKKKLVVLVGTPSDLARYSFERSHTPYNYEGKARYTRYYGTIDTKQDHCGTSDSIKPYCSYRFLKNSGADVEYRVFKTSQKPLIYIEENGEKHYIFDMKDKKVADRFAEAESLTCSPYTLPPSVCRERLDLLESIIKIEDINARFCSKDDCDKKDAKQQQQKIFDCNQKFYGCTESVGKKSLSSYKQNPIIFVKLSDFDSQTLGNITKSQDHACYSPWMDYPKKYGEIVNFLVNNPLWNLSILTSSNDARNMVNYLIEPDFYPKQVDCVQKPIEITEYDELWIVCDLPHSFDNPFYNLTLTLHNVDTDKKSVCKHGTCSDPVYEAVYNSHNKKWEVKMYGQGLKGQYRVSLEYEFRSNKESVAKPVIAPATIDVDELGIYNDHLSVYFGIVYFISVLIALVFFSCIQFIVTICCSCKRVEKKASDYEKFENETYSGVDGDDDVYNDDDDDDDMIERQDDPEGITNNVKL